MQIIKSLIFAIATCSPLVTYAFATDDSSIQRALKDHNAAVIKYAEGNSKAVPTTVDYKYGMKLDIAKVVRTSPEMNVCKVIPQLMTYEDSKGELNTVQYQVQSRCRGKN
uniref:DUF2790 domain-containing protein n=1 Tax=Pseudomonas syringae pv. actinidiae TaxID=103796 RepID=A0A2P0QH61_PSESF|nr:DUF2790 domain-containing protein [Pseudomonas syringae]ARO44849.1 hypothetical protein [Pseudomonas syringae pv. actinidiae]